jgi:hypothetical protein
MQGALVRRGDYCNRMYIESFRQKSTIVWCYTRRSRRSILDGGTSWTVLIEIRPIFVRISADLTERQKMLIRSTFRWIYRKQSQGS